MSRRPIVLALSRADAAHVGVALATAAVAAYENPTMSNRHARVVGKASDRLLRAAIAVEVNDTREDHYDRGMSRVEALHSIAAAAGCDLIRAAYLLDRDEWARPRDFKDGRR